MMTVIPRRRILDLVLEARGDFFFGLRIPERDLQIKIQIVKQNTNKSKSTLLRVENRVRLAEQSQAVGTPGTGARKNTACGKENSKGTFLRQYGGSEGCKGQRLEGWMAARQGDTYAGGGQGFDSLDAGLKKEKRGEERDQDG